MLHENKNSNALLAMKIQDNISGHPIHDKL